MRPTVVVARDALGLHLVTLPEQLLKAGYDVWLASPLYHVPERDVLWQEMAARSGALVLLQPLYPRAIEVLCRNHGVWHDGSAVFDLRSWESADGVVDELQSAQKPPAGEGQLREFELHAGTRWYPVVDERRCTHCGSCHQFCLFGVYALDGQGRVRIVNPDQCKPGCPACSRICPQGALMFPLYTRDEAIAGAPGKFPKPDATARRMFYSRTGATCPTCGQSGKFSVKSGRPVCGECGRTSTPVAQCDELDALLDGLEQLQEGQR